MARLDKELLSRNLVDSRTKAQELIKKGLVLKNGKVLNKVSAQVGEEDILNITENEVFKYVSRGGFKLEKAIKAFDINFKDKVVMDIGSSTGGFTDCALQNGAKKVIAIDVGTNLLHPKLRSDKRVTLFENTNIKDALSEIFQGVDIIVTDVSFISISKIFERINNENNNFEIMCLIKPQFECGKEIAKKYKGVILNAKIHEQILTTTINMFNLHGYYVQGLDFSPIKGGDGNIEYIAYLSKINQNKNIDIQKVVVNAFNNKF